jgi:hypothetical protein
MSNPALPPGADPAAAIVWRIELEAAPGPDHCRTTRARGDPTLTMLLSKNMSIVKVTVSPGQPPIARSLTTAAG